MLFQVSLGFGFDKTLTFVGSVACFGGLGVRIHFFVGAARPVKRIGSWLGVYSVGLAIDRCPQHG